jgi:hypothetical protein
MGRISGEPDDGAAGLRAAGTPWAKAFAVPSEETSLSRTRLFMAAGYHAEALSRVQVQSIPHGPKRFAAAF